MLLLVSDEEKVSVGRSWDALIEEGGGFESILLPNSADVGLGGCTPVANVNLAAVVMAGLHDSSVGPLPD